MNREHHDQSETPGYPAETINRLVTGCNELVSATEVWIEEASHSEWIPSLKSESKKVLFNLVLRTIVVKQFESLKTILTLENYSQGYSASPLLRAMCEELIWVNYLESLDEHDAAFVVVALANVGVHETFLAQEGFGIPNDGFSSEWKIRSSEAEATERSHLRQFFAARGFRLRSKDVAPSIWQIAKAVEMEDIYRFLYHATSRSVHFNVPEIFRRIWGKPGSIRLSSQTFERYWAAFSLFWGGWLFGLTFSIALPILGSPDFADENILRMDKAIELMRQGGAIPILTNQEVFWPYKRM